MSIITTKRGRRTSVLTDQDVDKHAQATIGILSSYEEELLWGLLDQDEEEQIEVSETMLQHRYHTTPISMEQFLEDPYYLGESCDTLFPQLREDLINLFDYPYREVLLCLHPDTEIPLLDGTVATMKKLIEKWNNTGESIWIYSVDDDGNVVPAKAEQVRYTGEDDYYRVTLDDGSSFTGNARHRMVLRDGTKKMIRDMKLGDSIMPFVTKESVRSKGRRIDGYELIFNPRDEVYKYTHAICAEYKHGPIDSRKMTIHHDDFDKRNNEPRNLVSMSWKYHQKLHADSRKAYLAKNKDVRKKLIEKQTLVARNPESPLRIEHKRFMNSEKGRKLSRYNLGKASITKYIRRERLKMASRVRWQGEHSEKQRNDASERMRVFNLSGNAKSAGRLNWVNRSEKSRRSHLERLVKRNTTGPRARLDITLDKIVSVVEGGAVTMTAAAVALGCSIQRIRTVFKKADVPLGTLFKHSRNHCVMSIEKIGRGPVCCMTVPKYENFAILTKREDGKREGVFSSNTGGIGVGKTMGLSIALCRVIYELSCLVNPQKTFGLSTGSELVIPVISKNLILARDVMKTAVDDKIRESQYFMKEFAPKFSKENTVFPNNIRLIVGSYISERVLGTTVIAVGLDECLNKFSLISIINSGRYESVTVGDLMVMGPEEKSQCKVVGYDHGANRIKAGWWRIKESTVQPLVRIRTSDGEISPSKRHPVLVRRDDWLVYIHAEDIVPGDFVVMEKNNAKKRTEIKQRSASEDIGGCEEEGGREKSILWEDPLRGDEEKDEGSEGQTEDCSFRRNQEENKRVPEGARNIRRGKGENTGESEAQVGRRGSAKEAVRRDEGKNCIWGSEMYSQPKYEGKEKSFLWEETHRGNEGENTRGEIVARRDEAYRGVESEDFARECEGNKRQGEEVQVPREVTRRCGCSMPDGSGTEVGGSSLRSERGILGLWRGSDGMGGVRVGRATEADCGGLYGEEGRWTDCDCRGERSWRNLRAKEYGEVSGDVGALSKEWAFDDLSDEQQETSERIQWAFCDTGVCRSCDCGKSSAQADANELKFAGVRQERTRVEDLPTELCLVRVESVEELPAEQTYSICTEFQTFIADGFVVHNTNFPPTRRAQQITTGFGRKKTVAHFDVVEKIYRGLKRRIESRFLNVGGDFPGMVILASSAASLESFTERKIRESVDDPNVFIRDHAPWTAKPAEDFCGEVFWVLCSTSSLKARIIEEDEYDKITDEYLLENEAWIMDIPIEYKSDFEVDIENALRDIAGVPTQAISAFIQRVDAVDDCVDPEMKHPFSTYEWTAGGPGQFNWGYLCRKFNREIEGGFMETAYAPKINPKELRWCHIDTSVSGDASGFTVGHIDRWVEVVRRDGDGNRYTELAPSYIIDVMLRINPPSGEQIYLPDLRRLVYEMMLHGYSFMGFSTDQYMYVEMHQQVKRRGIHCELISMDRTTEPYDELKSAMYEDRIEYYRYEPFIEELKALEYDRLAGKIDHPLAGSKDVSDSVAGVVWGLLQGSVRLPISLKTGTSKLKGHKHGWVSPLIPADQVDIEEVRELKNADGDVEYMPIIFGDEDE